MILWATYQHTSWLAKALYILLAQYVLEKIFEESEDLLDAY